MIVLGIETATPHGGAALWQDGRISASAENDGALSHSRRLMPSIDAILKETGFELGDLDGIAVSIGPGSFTGLRIGLAVAKTLSHAAQKPIVPIPTLEALAERFAMPGVLLAPMLDARRSEVFGALFRKNENKDRLQRLCPDVVEAPAVFAARIEQYCLAGGSGAQRYAEFLSNELGERVRLVQDDLNNPAASVVAAMGARELIAGRSANVLTLEPVYVRKSDAEISAAHRANKKQ